MGRARMILTAVLLILVLVVVLQNTETVSSRILFFEFAAPKAILLFVMLSAGFVLGLLVSIRWTSGGKASGAKSSAGDASK